ncbi:MAG: cupin protein [Actinoallomurus sp.]|jgi:gentisate 1,2-dioxygenase|nr:cupin protein [Actinoallomurus sp.]
MPARLKENLKEKLTRTKKDDKRFDPTVAAPEVNVADYGFEGRFEDWSQDARFFEYSKAADPIASGHTPPVPIERFSPELYAGGPTRVIPLDLSEHLGVKGGAATSPALLANFVRINAGDRVATDPNATSELYYVMEGAGYSDVNGRMIRWEKGDFVTLPAGSRSTHHAAHDTVMYWVHDEPLLRYLGAEATRPRFRPTKFARADAVAELERIASQPDAGEKSRVSVLLANAEEEQTLTITHVLWAMFGVLPAGQDQRPHRHQSVALDLILDCPPGCYTLLGDRLDEHGDIVDPVRVDWEPGGAFVTPPGKWHAHYNESGRDAHLIPVQDAGLHTYLRSLNIQFGDRP